MTSLMIYTFVLFLILFGIGIIVEKGKFLVGLAILVLIAYLSTNMFFKVKGLDSEAKIEAWGDGVHEKIDKWISFITEWQDFLDYTLRPKTSLEQKEEGEPEDFIIVPKENSIN